VHSFVSFVEGVFPTQKARIRPLATKETKETKEICCVYIEKVSFVVGGTKETKERKNAFWGLTHRIILAPCYGPAMAFDSVERRQG